MKRRIFSFLLALVLVAGMLPVPVYAEGTCTCTSKCTEDQTNEECPVCSANWSACGYVDPVAVTGVNLSQSTLTLDVGATGTLIATVVPADAANQEISWSTSDAAVAAVSGGTVTGVGAGTATITVTTTDGGFTATCKVTVNTVPVTGVSINPATAEVIKDATVQLAAVFEPTNATNKAVAWSSGDSGIATVDANGLVTGVAVGETTITVTTADGGKTAACAVTVKPVPVSGVSLDKTSLILEKTKAETLTATVSPENAANKAVTWTSSDEAVATVADGVVTAVEPGTATITVTTTDGKHTAQCEVTVFGTNASDAELTLSLGGDTTATATLTSPTDLVYDGKAKEATVTYSENWPEAIPKPSVSYENNTNAGEVIASIKLGMATAKLDFEIQPADLERDCTVEISPEPKFFGEKPTVTVKRGGNTLPASDYEVTYSEDKSKGTLTVTVTPASGNLTGKFEKTFNVAEPGATITRDGVTMPYANLGEAVENCRSGDVVTMCKDSFFAGSIPAGVTLVIPSGKALTVNGTLTMNGTLNNSGIVTGEGPITGEGTFILGTGGRYVTKVTRDLPAPEAAALKNRIDFTVPTLGDGWGKVSYTVEPYGASLTNKWQESPTFTGLTREYWYDCYIKTTDGDIFARTTSASTSVKTSLDLCKLEAGYFTFASPANLTYDGKAKNATVKANRYTDELTDDKITVEYYGKDGKKLDKAPVNAGTYTVKIKVAETDNFAAAELADEAWTFEIKKADPVKPTGLKGATGQTLADVKLPAGWKWVVPTTPIEKFENFSAKATYTPADAANYNAVTWDLEVTVNAHKVTFDSKGGTAVAAVIAEHNKTITAAPKDPTRTVAKDDKAAAWRFDGWYTSTEFKDTQKWDFTKSNVTHTTTLYAKWTAMYALNFDDNTTAAVQKMPKDMLQDTKEFKVDTAKPTRYGYSFSSWNTKADGSGTKVKAGAKFTMDQDDHSVTLYAQWKKADMTNGKTGDYIMIAVAVLAVSGLALAGLWAYSKKKKK